MKSYVPMKTTTTTTHPHTTTREQASVYRYFVAYLSYAPYASSRSFAPKRWRPRSLVQKTLKAFSWTRPSSTRRVLHSLSPLLRNAGDCSRSLVQFSFLKNQTCSNPFGHDHMVLAMCFISLIHTLAPKCWRLSALISAKEILKAPYMREAILLDTTIQYSPCASFHSSSRLLQNAGDYLRSHLNCAKKLKQAKRKCIHVQQSICTWSYGRAHRVVKTLLQNAGDFLRGRELLSRRVDAPGDDEGSPGLVDEDRVRLVHQAEKEVFRLHRSW